MSRLRAATCAPVLLVPLAGCLLNDVIPDEEVTRTYRRGLVIQDPAPGIVSPTSTVFVQVRLRDWPAVSLTVTANDSLVTQRSYESGDPYLSVGIRPFHYAPPGSSLSIRVVAEDVLGLSRADSVALLLESAYEYPPTLKRPADEHVVLTPVGTLRLESDPYDHPGSESYIFSVASDPSFADASYQNRNYNYVDIANPQPGRYYWRVGIISSDGLESPWSETRVFDVVDSTPDPYFQSFSRVEKLAIGQSGSYLIGDLGSTWGIVKCDPMLAPQWLYRMPEDARSIFDCDELADGRVVAVVRVSYSAYSLVGLSADGEGEWEQPLSSTATSVRGANDGGFVIGSASSTFLRKIDSTGAIEWQHTGNVDVTEIRATNDRSAFVMLCSVPGGGYEVRKCGLDGDFDWIRSLHVPVNAYYYPFVLTPLADGGYLFGSTVQRSGYSSVYAVRIDAGGQVLWQSDLGTAFDVSHSWSLGDFREDPSGSLYMLATSRPSSRNEMLLARLTAAGAPVWTRTFGSGSRLEGVGVASITGGLGLIGEAENAAVVLAVDADGRILSR